MRRQYDRRLPSLDRGKKRRRFGRAVAVPRQKSHARIAASTRVPRFRKGRQRIGIEND